MEGYFGGLRGIGTIITVIALVALVGGLGSFGYLMYRLGQNRVDCPCEMAKNRECVP